MDFDKVIKLNKKEFGICGNCRGATPPLNEFHGLCGRCDNDQLNPQERHPDIKWMKN